MLEVLIPYFVAGLARNEKCLWIASSPLPAAEAREALRAVLPSLDALVRRGQIEFLDHAQWYLQSGDLGPEAVIEGWLKREEAAVRDGYDGLRLTGNMSFLERKDWSTFAQYEADVHATFHDRRILAICSYPLDRCSSSGLLDVLRNHRLALVSNGSGWVSIQSAVALIAEVRNHHAVAQGGPPSGERDRSDLEDFGRPKPGVDTEHEVRFYREAFPAEPVGEVLTASLQEGSAALAIATAAHLVEIREAIGRRGLDVPGAVRRGQLVLLDAEQVLADLHVGGELSQARFDTIIGELVSELRSRFTGVRAFGEMVDILLRDGQPARAVQLEGMWNELLRRAPFRLLCAYDMGHFHDAASLQWFSEVCSEHGIVHPASAHAAEAGLDSGRLLAHFEQRTRALQNELDRRWQLERERSRLLESEREAAAAAEAAQRHLARLQRVTSALCEAATLADIGRVVRNEVTATAEATHARVAVALHDGELEFLQGDAAAGTSPPSSAEPAPLRRGPPRPLAEAYRTGAPVWLTSPDQVAERYPGAPPGLSTVIALPMAMGSRRHGAVALEFTAARDFTTSDLALFDDIARQLALACDRARLYEAAEAARVHAEQANRAKDEFLAMLGHELRNPLSPILTALELMSLRLGDIAHKERSIIERQTQHMVRLVDDLLDVSRIARGSLELSRQELELSEVVERAIEMVRPMLDQHAHRLATSVPGSGLLVDADPHRLAQAVANLLTNAAKFTPDGGHIEVRATASGGRVRLAVRDDGVGIDAALLPRVFDLFVQGRQGLERASGGLGLGLCIVRRLVELHGGSVTAHSEGAGRGSTFTLELPLVPAVGRGDEAEPHGASPDGERWNGRRSTRTRRRVLVVDDNQDAAAMLAEALEMFGHEICVAHDGPSALAVTQQFRPDVALLDIGLPVMNGFELAQRLRAGAGAGQPLLIAVTGYGQPTDCARASEAGFDHHLTKPVNLAQLMALIGGHGGDAPRLRRGGDGADAAR